MCGIAGFIDRPRTDSRQTLAQMKKRIVHRGPDGTGEFLSEVSGWNIALGHQRLSIIDVEGGAQPISSADGKLQIVFNGEIFNFLELRPGLESKGYSFKTRTDTEVILHLYEEYGDKSFPMLNGMAAFALWDERDEALTLVRDAAGIKPLYYAPLESGGIVFASELTALTEYPGLSRRVSSRGLGAYFFSDYISPPETIFEGIFKLPPGHLVRWTKGRLEAPQAYWKLEAKTQDPDSVESLPDQLWAGLKKSVERQLISDVPVGVFLSGGIDSSCVAALASELKGQIQTYSIRFDEKDYDESSFARSVSRHLGTDHQERTLSVSALLSTLRPSLDCLDEPMADPSVLPTRMVSKLASEHVKVVLGGDGGDELWAGYPTYWAHRVSRIYGLFPRWFREQVFPGLLSRVPAKMGYQSWEWKAKRFVERWDADPLRRHLRWMSNTDLPQLESLLGKNQDPAVLNHSAVSNDETNRLLSLDFETYLPNSVLTKVDRASMYHSLEVRPPFLDQEFVRWSFQLPSEWKLRGRRSKYLLKLAASERLPAEIIHRSKKGFAIPVSRWLGRPLKPEIQGIFSQSPLWEGRSLVRSGFQRMFEDHLALKADHSKPLWGLLVLDHWAKRLDATF